MKSTWPGVSIRLTTWPFHANVVAAAVIEMPRSCSCAIQSVTVDAVVDFADPRRHARVEEDALGRRRLARVDMGHDPDVSGPVQRDRAAIDRACVAMMRSGGLGAQSAPPAEPSLRVVRSLRAYQR